MPPFGPINRKNLIKSLKKLGFDGPYSGGKHSFMKKGNLALRIPNPHKGDIAIGLLNSLLKQINVSRKIWEKL